MTKLPQEFLGEPHSKQLSEERIREIVQEAVREEFEREWQEKARLRVFVPQPGELERLLGEIESVVRRVVREELHERDRLQSKFSPFVGELEQLKEQLARERWRKVMDEAAEFHGG